MLGTNISFQGTFSRRSSGSKELPKIETGIGFDEDILKRLERMLPTLSLTPGDAMTLEGRSESGDKLTISSKHNKTPDAEIKITTPQGDSLVLYTYKNLPPDYNDLVSKLAEGIKDKIEGLQRVLPAASVFRLDDPIQVPD